jgi:hypothetical protein
MPQSDYTMAITLSSNSVSGTASSLCLPEMDIQDASEAHCNGNSYGDFGVFA